MFWLVAPFAVVVDDEVEVELLALAATVLLVVVSRYMSVRGMFWHSPIDLS